MNPMMIMSRMSVSVRSASDDINMAVVDREQIAATVCHAPERRDWHLKLIISNQNMKKYLTNLTRYY